VIPWCPALFDSNPASKTKGVLQHMDTTRSQNLFAEAKRVIPAA
jgi:hypothetical protein